MHPNNEMITGSLMVESQSLKEEQCCSGFVVTITGFFWMLKALG